MNKYLVTGYFSLGILKSQEITAENRSMAVIAFMTRGFVLDDESESDNLNYITRVDVSLVK